MADGTIDRDDYDEWDDRPVLTRRPVGDTADLDITPMIDITFLLLIFFLVCSTMSQQTAVDLAPARHGGGVSEKSAIMITIAESSAPATDPNQPPPAQVFLADGAIPSALVAQDPDVQRDEIIKYVRQGADEGKTDVLIKAARGVLRRDVAAVETAVGAADVADLQMHHAVFEVR